MKNKVCETKSLIIFSKKELEYGQEGNIANELVIEVFVLIKQYLEHLQYKEDKKKVLKMFMDNVNWIKNEVIKLVINKEKNEN